MKVVNAVVASIAATVLVSASPAPLVGAEAQTCTQTYMVCLNNRPEGSWWEETQAELRCLRDYYGCLRKLGIEV